MSIHVIPENDLREHEQTLDCWCEPDTQWMDDDGEVYPNGPLVSHHSADWREHAEAVLGDGLGEHKKWSVSVVAAVILVVLCVRGVSAETVRTYHVKSTVREVIDKLQARDGAPLMIPPIIKEADLEIGGFAYPKRQAYRGHVKLLTPYNPVPILRNTLKVDHVYKSLSVQQLHNPFHKDTNDYIRVTATVDVRLARNRFPLRWVNPIKDRAVLKAEGAILDAEEKIIRDFAEGKP